MKTFVHNGDVQAIESEIPKLAKQIKPEPLAYGEKSGHIHIPVGDFQLFKDEDNFYLKVGNDGASLEHVHTSVFSGDYSKTGHQVADHKPTLLAPNKSYKIGIHRRYNPYAKVFEISSD